MPRGVQAIAAATVIIALTACTASQLENEPSITPAPSEADRPTPTVPIVHPAPSEEPAVIGEVPAQQLDAILADAANRTGADVAEIAITRAEALTWPDGSLGCPERGQAYTQALVDGYHVVLDAAGETLDYRATTAGSFRLCEDSGRPG